MASNNLPNSFELLCTLAEDMADGCHNYEVGIGIKQNLEADVRADLAPAEAAQSTYNTQRAAKTALGTNQTLVDSQGRTFLASARLVLIPKLGSQWNDAWLPTGFPGQSTAVPDTIGERQALLFSLNAYFTNVPGNENAPLGVTAAQALILADGLSTVRSNVNDAANHCAEKKTLRDDAVVTLRKRMTGLITELEQLLDANDPRWYAFGLNPPGAPETPEIPEVPVLTPGTPGVINIVWVAAPRAEYYRVFKQVVGVDADFVFLANPHDTNLTANGFVTGATVKVCVSAVNDAGESQKSDAAEIVVP